MLMLQSHQRQYIQWRMASFYQVCTIRSRKISSSLKLVSS
jgi:hypothetical protein